MAHDGALTFGRYRVAGPLGKGGMAIVYRAHDPELNREVAVKVMTGSRSMFPEEALERFQRELRALAQVEHPNVLRIFDGGEAAGAPYLVTELVEGQTLEKMLRAKGPLPIPRVMKLTGELLDALTAVHAAGLLHRDIKPSNLMVTTEGRLVLMDFGIALAAFSETLTKTGEVPGTLAYLPPECLGGQKATPASDLFQVGLVLYEMLVGKPLFTLQSPKDFLLSYGDLPPKDLQQRREDLPGALEALTRKALSPQFGDRWQTAREMLEALRGETPAAKRVRVASKKPAAPPAPAAVWRPSLVQLAVAGAVVFSIAAGAAAAVAWFSRPPAPPSAFDARVTAEALELTWTDAKGYRGAAEIDLGPIGAFVVEESQPARSHRLRVPGSFEGLSFRVKVGAAGGELSTARLVGPDK